MDFAPPPRVLFQALIFALLLSPLSCSTDPHPNRGARKLLPKVKPSSTAVTDRMDDSCSKDDIVVYQGETAPLPNGIPTYTVQVLNVCLSRCAVSDIHVTCGWFSSARLINPRVFRRIAFDDCLVNDGAALGPGQSLSFQYANTYRYPIYVTSASCSKK